MTVAYALDCRGMCVILGTKFFKGGENVKPEKNAIFLKNGKTVICRCSTG